MNRVTRTASTLLAFFTMFTSLSFSQTSHWSAASLSAATPTTSWSAVPAVLDRTLNPVLGLSATSAVGGSWVAMLPTLRLVEPPTTDPAYAVYSSLVSDFPWLVNYHWEAGQVPPTAGNPSTADLLNAVGLGAIVNQSDVDSAEVSPLSPDPNALRRLIENVIDACRHHAHPVLAANSPVLFNPTSTDWASDLYGSGASPAWKLWLNASKSNVLLDGQPSTALSSARIAEVALGYQAPSGAEFHNALRRLHEIEGVGYEVWVTLVFLSPDSALTTTASYGEPAAVPEIDTSIPSDHLRMALSLGVSLIDPTGIDQNTVTTSAKQASTSASGLSTLFIPMPLSSIDTLHVEIPLALGGAVSVIASRSPFEPGFEVTLPVATPLIHPTADWTLSYPSHPDWPGFPIAPMPSPLALGIIQ